MPFDGFSAHQVVKELKDLLVGGRIDKIYQPEADQIVLNIRSKGSLYHLLLCAAASGARFQLTQKKQETPLSPPMFCMLLRKHLGGGKITDIQQIHFDRILEIDLEAMDELGDLKKKSLILEVMGKHSNLILVDEDLRIIDSIRHVNPLMSSVRQIGPGLTYTWPTHNEKTDPLLFIRETEGLSSDEVILELDRRMAPGPMLKAVYTSFHGFSPFSSRELLFRGKVEEKEIFSELSDERKYGFYQALVQLIEELEKEKGPYSLYITEEGIPFDFSVIPYQCMTGANVRSYTALDLLLDDYFTRIQKTDVLKQKAQDLRHLLSTNLDRVRKKLILQEKTLEDTKNREEDRIMADLITANVYQLKEGMTSCDLPNYYEEEMPLMHIQLDPHLSPAQNAQKYYRRYNKLKRTEEALKSQMEASAEEKSYLESVLAALDLSDCEQDLMDLREELSANGYLKKTVKGKKNLQKSKPIGFVTEEGVRGYIGKNNIQNDYLTFRLARPRDEWFHAKNIPGSHVILLVQDLVFGKDYTNLSLLQAAAEAALHCGSGEENRVTVDHTRVMYVKKPSGERPGFVRYTHEQSIEVPAEEIKKAEKYVSKS